MVLQCSARIFPSLTHPWPRWEFWPHALFLRGQWKHLLSSLVVGNFLKMSEWDQSSKFSPLIWEWTYDEAVLLALETRNDSEGWGVGVGWGGENWLTDYFLSNFGDLKPQQWLVLERHLSLGKIPLFEREIEEMWRGGTTVETRGWGGESSHQWAV